MRPFKTLLLLACSLAAGAAAAASLTGTVSNAPATYDLTPNSADWVHFGHIPIALDRKAGVAQQITDYTTVGGADPGSTDTTVVGYSWTDGLAPAGTITNSPTAKRVFDVGKGFQFSVPAKTTARTLKVFIGSYSAKGTLTASLSDNSAASFSTSIDAASGATIGRVITLNFRASNNTATLVVRYVVTKKNRTRSWITLDSAALDASGGGGAPLLNGSTATPGAVVNLTNAGPADWVHWGRISDQPTDRKAGVAQLISGHDTVGHDVSPSPSPTDSGATWSDGTPNPAVTNTQSGIRVFDQNKGMKVTAAADTTLRTVEVYVGANGDVRGAFKAVLSDGSAPAFTHTVSQGSGRNTVKISLTYQAGGTNRQLVITYERADTRKPKSWITLESVKLLGTPSGGGGGSAGGTDAGTAGLGDFVWSDTDGDGIQDGGETGIPGVGVALRACKGTTDLATTTTDGNGAYAFTDLAEGRYQMHVTAPADHVFSPRRQGSKRSKDSDAYPDGKIGCVAAKEGKFKRNFDAGLVPE